MSKRIMNNRTAISVAVPSSFVKLLENFCNERHINRSEALRALLYYGIQRPKEIKIYRRKNVKR